MNQLFWIFALLTLSRLIWFISNAYWLPHSSFLDILSCFGYGFYFDIPVVAYFMAPLILWQVIFPKLSASKPIVTKVLFTLPLFLILLFNGIDTAFSRINGKRSGYELFAILGDEGNKMAPFLRDYWIGILSLLIAVAFIYSRTPVNGKSFVLVRRNQPVKSILRILTSVCLFVLSLRGGWQLRPLRSIDANNFVEPQLSPLVYSTPFHIMSTWNGNGRLFPLKPLSDQKAASLVWGQKSPQKLITQKQNLIFIVVESLARDYTGFLNGAPYTPFLDKLSAQSVNFTHCYANGTKSIDMVPAIFCGLPNLMEEPLILSSYGGNRYESAFSIFKQQGYRTAFFHGGANGTMGFESFLKQTELQQYFGMDQYPEKERDYDGSWGIWDEPYLQYMARCLDTFNAPFATAVFTLSSHHPYKIPIQYQQRFPENGHTIQRSMQYTDYALEQFFNEARKHAWYAHTTFVITGDHTSHSDKEYFYSPSGHYEIPFLIFRPGIKPVTYQKTVSQCDIVPTVASFLGDNNLRLGLGRSGTDSSYNGYSLHYDKGLYYIVQYPKVMACDVRGNIKIYQQQIRNEPKAKLLPKTGSEFEDLKAHLFAYLQVFNARVRTAD